MSRIRLRRLFAWTTAAALVAALMSPVTGSAGTVNRVPVPEGSTTVFVELMHPPLSEVSLANLGNAAAMIAREQASFRQRASRAGIELKERFRYTGLFNGFSVTVKAADLPALARLQGVANIYPVVSLELPQLHSSTEMIRAPEVVADGYDGTGVKVAVIDTGIDYTHPDLGGCAAVGPGCRIEKGFDFVGDAYTGADSDIPAPDPDPMDQNGHGTHVAGIIGARAASPEGVTGVAPGVTFYAYKVFGADGPTSADVINAALEQAYADGADVVNMSLGASFQWPRYPTAVAADRLVQRGVVVSVSAGNSGDSGLFAGGAPSVGSRVLAVASFDNTMITVRRGDLSNGANLGYGVMTFSPDPAGQTYEMVAVPNLGNSDSDYAGLDVTGKVALISRGADTFAHKVARAQAHGAAAAIVHNNVTGFFAGTLGTPDNAGQPWIYAASIAKADGESLRSALSAGPLSITFTSSSQAVTNPTGNMVSSFSSWGPSPDLDLKPDLGAPGGMIYSTYPVSMGSYASLSGTSMAAPHVSGAAALLLQSDPRLRGLMAEEVLRNTAVPRTINPSSTDLVPVNRQGGGMIDILAAVSTPVRISPSKLSLGEFETSAPKTVTLMLTNKSDQTVTYNISHEAALGDAVAYPNSPSVMTGTLSGSATPSSSSVTLPPYRSTRVTVTIAPPADTADQQSIFSGWILFTSPDGLPALRVPYLGFWGDYQAQGTLEWNLYGMPWLASTDGSYYYYEDEMNLNPDNGEYAFVLLNLARQASRLRLTARSAQGRVIRVLDTRYVGRNAGPADFMELAWDGRDMVGRTVPNGDYRLVLEVLRPLGDDTNPAHWDTWTSGPIHVHH